MSGIDWVVFDLGEVVLARTERLTELAELLAVSADRLVAAYFGHRRDYDRNSDPQVYWTAVAEDAGGDAPTAALVAELTAVDDEGWSVTRPDTLALIDELHAAGLGLAVCSNAPTTMARTIEVQPWAGRFRHLVFSGDLTRLKPEPAIYDAVLAATGGAADRTVFFDDRADNVAGAVAVGWHAFVFTDAATARIQLVDLGVLPPE